MAKTTTCAFCGKELTTGFFNGTANSLVLHTHSVTCCDDCCNHYDDKKTIKRFELKLQNLLYRNRQKLTDQQVAAMFKAYVAEQADNNARFPGHANQQLGFARVAGNLFSVREYSLDTISFTLKGMLKTLKTTTNTECGLFTAADITRIEYAPVGHGESLGLFSRAYAYDIRLNDQKIMTYRPCITRTVVKASGFCPRKSAEKAILAELEAFKALIGSDLPIVRVKKFD